VVNTLQPGAGFNVDPKSLDVAKVQQSQSFAQKAHSLNATEFLLNVIPASFFNAFASGDILQVLLVAILSAFAISAMGARGLPILSAIDLGANVFFGIMRIVVRAAPIGAFGAMAFTVGSQGLGALKNLGFLMLCFCRQRRCHGDNQSMGEGTFERNTEQKFVAIEKYGRFRGSGTCCLNRRRKPALSGLYQSTSRAFRG
jgi:hypothetical protein